MSFALCNFVDAMEMPELNFPAFAFKLRREGKKTKIFDVVRKKYLWLSPEEWVRQHTVHYLAEVKGFPTSLMAVEKGLQVNGLSKRADIVCHGKDGAPLLLVECKAPHIKINQSTFDQIARYNSNFRLPYLLVTNGMEHYCCRIFFDQKTYAFLPDIPSYSELSSLESA